MENLPGWLSSWAARGEWRTARFGATSVSVWSAAAPRPRWWAASAREEAQGVLVLLAHAFLIQRAPDCRHASLSLTYFYFLHFSTSLGRIHDGKEEGVAFIFGGNGQVIDCKIWGNAKANVHVQDSGSQAVVKGCECVNANACPVTLFGLFGGRLRLRPVLNALRPPRSGR